MRTGATPRLAPFLLLFSGLHWPSFLQDGHSPSAWFIGGAEGLFNYPSSATLSEDVGAFAFTAIHSTDGLGVSVGGSCDVNGDGFSDILLGASQAAGSSKGQAFVVFGGSDTMGAMELGELDGSNGFRVVGINDGDLTGASVSCAGDFNGDGLSDIVIGASETHSDSIGQAYVVYGAASFAPQLNLTELTAAQGLIVEGIDNGDSAGFSVAGAGDVNGDGLGDVVIGAYGADPGGRSRAGEVYVVFGASTGSRAGEVGLSAQALDGDNGFLVLGEARDDYMGWSVSTGGDINGDGLDDIIIGAPHANDDSGRAYVLYGASSWSRAFKVSNLMDGTRGFALHGKEVNDMLGFSVSDLGDFNGDGLADFVVAAHLATPASSSHSNGAAGEAYIIFGDDADSTEADMSLEALNGRNGLLVTGADASDYAGWSVGPAGDVNGDGLADVVIGAVQAEQEGGNHTATATGAVYVVLGTRDNIAKVATEDLDGTDGFALYGEGQDHFFGYSVHGAGDVDGDGFDDLVVGSFDDSAGVSGDGASAYLISGSLGLEWGSPAPTPGPLPTTDFWDNDDDENDEEDPSSGASTSAVKVYDYSSREVSYEEEGGVISLATEDASLGGVAFSVSLLRELDTEGAALPTSVADAHTIDLTTLNFTKGDTDAVRLGGVAAVNCNFTASAVLPGGTAKVVLDMYVFQEAGSVSNGPEGEGQGGEALAVGEGTLKLGLTVEGWPFCDFAACGMDGGFLEVTALVSGPEGASALTATVDSAASTASTASSPDSSGLSSGQSFDMASSALGVTVVMSEWAHTSEGGWAAAEVSLVEPDATASGAEEGAGSSAFVVRLPSSNGTIFYDPAIELMELPQSDSTWWRDKLWVQICMVVGGLGVLALAYRCCFKGGKEGTSGKVQPEQLTGVGIGGATYGKPDLTGGKAPAEGGSAALADYLPKIRLVRPRLIGGKAAAGKEGGDKALLTGPSSTDAVPSFTSRVRDRLTSPIGANSADKKSKKDKKKKKKGKKEEAAPAALPPLKEDVRRMSVHDDPNAAPDWIKMAAAPAGSADVERGDVGAGGGLDWMTSIAAPARH